MYPWWWHCCRELSARDLVQICKFTAKILTKISRNFHLTSCEFHVSSRMGTFLVTFRRPNSPPPPFAFFSGAFFAKQPLHHRVRILLPHPDLPTASRPSRYLQTLPLPPDIATTSRPSATFEPCRCLQTLPLLRPNIPESEP